MEMVVTQGLLHWCVLCVQHNDWYIVGTQKILSGQRDKCMNNSTSKKVYWMNSSASHAIRQLSFKCGNKEMISYILFLFLFPQRIECDYFSNINSRFNNIIHMLKREWNFSTNAKIAQRAHYWWTILAKTRFIIAKMTSLSSTVQMKGIICSDLKRHIRNIHLVLF